MAAAVNVYFQSSSQRLIVEFDSSQDVDKTERAMLRQEEDRFALSMIFAIACTFLDYADSRFLATAVAHCKVLS